MPTKFEIKVAETPDEKREVYRLRYDVFSLELGDHRYSNHELKEYRDCDDVAESIVFHAKVVDSDKTVATSRLKPLKDRKFICADQFNLPLLSDIVGVKPHVLTASVGCVDRVATSREFRGQDANKNLFSAMERYALQIDVKTLVVAVRDTELKLIRYNIRKLGFSQYPMVGISNGVKYQCLYKVIS